MDAQQWQAEQFEHSRDHLHAVAYRMLGSSTDADDAVQEAWLRLNRSDVGAVESLTGWLTTVVSRICLDMLRSRRARREEPGHGGVQEPIVTPDNVADPEQELLLADYVGLALLVVLETLAPPRATRVRVARHVRDPVRGDRADRGAQRPRDPAVGELGAPPGPRRGHRGAGRSDRRTAEVVDAFLAASRSGDFEALQAFPRNQQKASARRVRQPVD